MSAVPSGSDHHILIIATFQRIVRGGIAYPSAKVLARRFPDKGGGLFQATRAIRLGRYDVARFAFTRPAVAKRPSGRTVTGRAVARVRAAADAGGDPRFG